MRAESALPALPALAAGLRRATEVLANELACPTDRVPQWSATQWRIAMAVAVIHGVSPLLSSTLRWRGPEDWRELIDAQRMHTLRRHERIAKLISAIDSAARAAQMSITAMKGAALHARGIYAPGERPMADIDLLVRPADMPRAVRLLASLGYAQSLVTSRERVFMPAGAGGPFGLGEHSNNAVKIELKSRIAQPLPFHEIDITALLLPATAPAGVNFYATPAALMMHLLLHAAGNIRMRGVRLIQVHDIALLAARFGAADWDELSTTASRERLRWVFPPLALTARYYPGAVPAHVLACAQANCTWALRRVCRQQSLTDLSASKLWIEAFPGIEWAASMWEALRYVGSRALPSRGTRNDRLLIAATQTWALHSEWMHASQWRRVMKWAASPAPRVETLASVRAAWHHADRLH